MQLKGCITKTGAATADIDTACVCSIGSNCDKNTQERDGGAKTLRRYAGESEVHVPATSCSIAGGVHKRRSAVATAHINSTSGGSRSRDASDVMLSQEKMKLL